MSPGAAARALGPRVQRAATAIVAHFQRFSGIGARMRRWIGMAMVVALGGSEPGWAQGARPRARDIGVAPGVFQPGRLNAITDVAGVRVGQTTEPG